MIQTRTESVLQYSTGRERKKSREGGVPKIKKGRKGRNVGKAEGRNTKENETQ